MNLSIIIVLSLSFKNKSHTHCIVVCIAISLFINSQHHPLLFIVEYQISPSMLWYPCMYEQSVVEHLLKTQFHDFIERVKTTDCQAELRRLLKNGPPIYISDKNALPIIDVDVDGEEVGEDKDKSDTAQSQSQSYICSLWYANNPDKEISSKLHGAVEGDDRDNLWTELKEFLVEEGKEPGDEDNGKEE
jgi:hypothetical protein